MVVDISRDQYVARVVLLCELADARDRLQPCQLEAAHLRAVDEAKDLANLPVGRMNESECHNGSALLLE